MRIMIDSNVIISAIYKRYSKSARAFHYVCENHVLVLCDRIIAECYDIVIRKFPQHTAILGKFLEELKSLPGYENVTTAQADFTMTAPKDEPILNAAILANVDVLISSDEKFLALNFKHPKVLTPSQYME